MMNTVRVVTLCVLALATVVLLVLGVVLSGPSDGQSIVHTTTATTTFSAYAPRAWRGLMPSADAVSLGGPLVPAMPFDGCEPQTSGEVLGDAVVLVGAAGDCSLVERAVAVQLAAISASGRPPAAILAGISDPFVLGNDTTLVHVPTVLLEPEDVATLQWSHLGEWATVALVRVPFIDPAMFVLMALALATLLLATLWRSYIVRHEIAEARAQPTADSPQDHGQSPRDSRSYFTLASAVGLLVMSTCTLVLAYFFPFVIVYVTIVLFCIGSLQGVYSAGRVLCDVWLPALRRDARRFTWRFVSVSWVDIAILAFGVALEITWITLRNTRVGWIFQDVLAIGLMVLMLMMIALPNIKVAAVLLVLMFIYDVVFVFALPVMEAVASGGGTGEQVPLLVRVPRMIGGGEGQAGLGLGDIVLPGLLIMFCREFDLKKTSLYPQLRQFGTGYYFWAMIGYACGLLVTFISLALMRRGQPALLYLVPGTLGTTLLVSLRRRELKKLWSGVYETSNDAELLERRITDVVAAETPVDDDRFDADLDVSDETRLVEDETK